MFKKIQSAIRKVIAAIRKALSPNKMGWRYTRVIRHAFYRVETKHFDGYTDGEPNGKVETVVTFYPRNTLAALRLFVARVIVAWYIVWVIYSVYPQSN